MNTKRIITFCLFATTSITCLFAQAGRWEKKLSGEDWKLWLDQTALWYDDDIYLPPVDISTLPVNPPSCGWNGLHEVKGLALLYPVLLKNTIGERLEELFQILRVIM